MSSASEMAAQMIVCDRGLGKLLPGTCARRWRIANGKEPGDCGSGQECVDCPAGELRSEGVVAPRRPASALGRTNGKSDRDCLRCRTLFCPVNPRQKFCKMDACKKERSRLSNKRAQQKEKGRLVTRYPWEVDNGE